MDEPGGTVRIEVPGEVDDSEDVHAEVCIHPEHHREDGGDQDDHRHHLDELEDKLYRRCFDKVTCSIGRKSKFRIFHVDHFKVDDLCGDDKVDGEEEEEANTLIGRKESSTSMVDKKRDGKISVVKLQKIISRLEDHENPLYLGPVVNRMDQKSKRDMVKNTLNEIDKNQDGYICYEEFKQFVAKVRRSQILSTQKSRY